MAKEKTKAKWRISTRACCVLVGVLTYLLLFAMLITSATPEQYDLRVGQVAPLTITATKDVEDTVTTQQLVDAAMAAVQPYYISDSTVAPVVLSNLNSSFAAMENIRSWEIPENGMTNQQLSQARPAIAPLSLNADQFTRMLEMSGEDFSALRSELTELVSGILSGNLADGQQNEAIAKLLKDLSNTEFSDAQIELGEQLARAFLRPNMFLDKEVTEANRQKAAQSVEPIVYIKGRNIVKSGEIITRAQIAMLDSLGLLKNKAIDVLTYLGIAILLFVLLFAVAAYLWLFDRKTLENPKQILLLGTICVITSFSCLLTQQISIYLMPVCLAALLTALLLDFRLSLIINLVQALLAGLMASGSNNVFSASMFAVLMTSLVSGTLSLVVLYRKQHRLTVLFAGIVVGLGNAITSFTCGMLNNADISLVLRYAGWSGLSGLLSSILCIGLQPALEWLFNLVTSSKLLEMSNPNHPLIRRLILEASGTYHHSIIVANLSEAAADSIGANGLLARVGAYYHDVGKLKRPLYFKENQMGDNPHDRTDPLVSTAIVTAHPRDGVALAQKLRMPQPILDIIEQHHGDTPVIYFYDRACKQYGAENTRVEDFRYTGPKPQSVEAAVVMLADTVEAAARSMQEPTPEKINALIHKLVRSKMDDGQLDECPLTLRDLDKISAAFMTVLNGAFHERVEYPNVNVTRAPAMPAQPTAQPAAPAQPAADAPQDAPAADTPAKPEKEDA